MRVNFIKKYFQVVWQGYILNAKEIRNDTDTLHKITSWNNGITLEVTQQSTSMITLVFSILTLSIASLTCFVPNIADLYYDFKKYSGVIFLLLTSQIFRSLSMLLIIAAIDRFALPIFLCIFFCNLYILDKSRVINDKKGFAYVVYIFFNAVLNIPMIGFFNEEIDDIFTSIDETDQSKIDHSPNEDSNVTKQFFTAAEPRYSFT